MHQEVKFITRTPEEGGTTIDHVWANIPCKCSPMNALDDLSDHRAIKMVHKTSQREVTKERTIYQNGIGTEYLWRVSQKYSNYPSSGEAMTA